MKWIKKQGIKFHLFLIMLGTVFTTFLFVYLRGSFRAKRQMEYRLSRVRKETELLHLEKDGEEKFKRIEELKAEENDIKDKIKFIEEKEFKGEEVLPEELEKFFNERGF